ncbi:MAG: hypothetical protein H0X42_08765 [Solirubrobacterales bacterium]|nr:hypothetical protein [Solirubrobacterales bacterium]
MISKLHNRLGTAGLTVAMIALVVALGGTAFAAQQALNGKQKKEVTKIARQFAGQPGTQGAKGDAGAQGTQGAKGDPGTNGKDGKSVATSAASTGVGGECPTVGGAKFEVEGSGSSSHVCNGKNGTNGTTGFTETLPTEKTETGLFGSFVALPIGRKAYPISFPIPLAEGSEVEPVVVDSLVDGVAGKCPGRGGGTLPPTGEYTPTIPEAEPGFLCIYLMEKDEAVIPGSSPKIGVYEEGSWFGEKGVSEIGTVFEFECPNACVLAATWAVTAPAE